MSKITQERLKELFNYDSETGLFERLTHRGGMGAVGRIAGNVQPSGYVRITVDYKKYYAHRLAWLYVYGVWPTNEIDHRDTIKHHNWISNLRDATKKQNLQNQIKAHKSNKSSGLLGVSFEKRRGKFRATIGINGKNRSLGRFETAELAHAAYIAAKRIHHLTCPI